ncbi:MAG: LLM class flavin-dependent oxidoreductase [Gammaproteobacteria bacterium]|nr:LLM class flavin-dependent oxidoreductase [Gammaproteobacteria bacterium]
MANRQSYFNPKPVQRPHPPIFVGGESDAALGRVVRFGDGWYGFDLSPEQFTIRMARLQVLLDAAGRSREAVQVFVCPNRHRLTPESVAAYRAAGVDQLIAPLFARNLEDLERRADRLASLTR